MSGIRDTRERAAGLRAPDMTRVALIATHWHRELTDQLVAGARRELEDHGVEADRVEVMRVPGAWELPLAARWAALSGRFDAIVALGCVVRGDTPHFGFIAGECARGLMEVQLEHGLPLAFGVLTTETLAQAEERADPTRMDKGGEAALAVLEMLAQKQQVEL